MGCTASRFLKPLSRRSPSIIRRRVLRQQPQPAYKATAKFDHEMKITYAVARRGLIRLIDDLAGRVVDYQASRHCC